MTAGIECRCIELPICAGIRDAVNGQFAKPRLPNYLKTFATLRAHLIDSFTDSSKSSALIVVDIPGS